jgi:hypothetical protein
MTKEIPLTQGQVAIVDDWRYDELNQYKWHAAWDSKTRSFYARRNSFTLLGNPTTISMHAVVARTPKGFDTDHANRKTLDNREENLRVCTCAQNSANQIKRSNNTSGYKGIRAHGKGWQAKIVLNGIYYYLGTYPTREEAAKAYDNAATELHGEFANLNF